MKKLVLGWWDSFGWFIWRIGIFMLVCLAILLPKISSIPPLGTEFESPTYLGIQSFTALVDNLAFLPEQFIQFTVIKLGLGTGLNLRLISVGFAILGIAIIYNLLKSWHTIRVSILTVLLFATSSWFLHQARWAGPEVLYLLALPSLFLAAEFLKHRRYDKLMPLSILLVGSWLYLPGLMIFILPGLFLARKDIKDAWQRLSNFYRTLSVLSSVLVISPLVYGLWRQPKQIIELVGLPEWQFFSLSGVLTNLINIPKHLFISGPDTPLSWLPGTPILDIFTIAMFIVGVYAAYKTGLHPVRRKMVLTSAVISIILISLGGPVTLSLLIPLIYITVANGLAFMLQQWFTVFPRNPVAHWLAPSLLIIAVLITCFFHLLRYYEAWPNNTEVRQAFSSSENR